MQPFVLASEIVLIAWKSSRKNARKKVKKIIGSNVKIRVGVLTWNSNAIKRMIVGTRVTKKDVVR